MALRLDNTVTTIAGDQAASLRRLIGSDGGRTVAITGGTGTGVTSLAINLAAALAGEDRHVVLMDEDESVHSATSRLQLRRRFGFDHAVSRDVRLDELLLQAPGFAVMPMHIPPELAIALPPGRQGQLSDEYDSMIARVDWVLIDARPVTDDVMPGLALSAEDVVVAITPSGDSITEAYATIKWLHTEYGRRDFWILANRVRTLETAMALFKRVREVAQRYLDVKLRLMGFVPEDGQLARADQLAEPVSKAFPQAEASIAFAQLANAMLRWPKSTSSADRANLLYRTLDICRRLGAQRR